MLCKSAGGTAVDILLGTSLGGYTLLRAIGSGGMGTVYLAEDPTIGHQVAIKVVHTDPTAYSDTGSMPLTRRFRQEARAVASLDHLHILPLYRYGEEETVGGQRAYIVMQYRPEGSLWDWLRRRAGFVSAESLASTPHLPAGLNTSWPLSVEEVNKYLRQAASALQYAHDRGIIHRDVKPANFLLRFDIASSTSGANTNGKAGYDVFLLLSDFGLAKMFSATSSASHVLGTPTYMAPEQFEGVAVPASDQYALAVMIYLLLTGRLPFEGDPMHLMHQHLSASRPSLRHLAPAVPPGIEYVLQRALAKKPDERYPSITEFANAFSQSLHDEQETFHPFAPSLSLPAVTCDSRKMSSVSPPVSGPMDAASQSEDHSASTVISSSPVSSPNYPAFLQPLSPLQNTPTIRQADAEAPTLYPALPGASPHQASAQYWTAPPASVSRPLLSPIQSQPIQQLQMPTPPDGNRTSRRSALAWILGGAAVLTLGAGAGFYIYQRLVPQQVKYVLTGHNAEVT